MKEDLIPIALYSCLMNEYKKARKFEQELIEYLKANYTIKEDNWDFESIVSDSVYGNESDVEEFMKFLKLKANKNKENKN